MNARAQRSAASPSAARGEAENARAAAAGPAAGAHRFGNYALDRSPGDPLPHPVRTGIEALAGMSLHDVRVQYGSREPARVDALAFTRGNVIHVARGAEHHLAHEAWHVVQQRRGRVPVTGTTGTGHPLNDDRALEQEADDMAERALRRRTGR